MQYAGERYKMHAKCASLGRPKHKLEDNNKMDVKK
jgi:hypothetical protein